jgi:hypothetical protein
MDIQRAIRVISLEIIGRHQIGFRIPPSDFGFILPRAVDAASISGVHGAYAPLSGIG